MSIHNIQMQSEQVNELFTALSKAQSEMKPAIKDSTNPHFKSNFSSLSACWDAAREALAKNSLSVIQTPMVSEGVNYLVSTLGHASGQFIRSVTPLITAKNDAQSFGASLTYFRRFSLCALVGISPEDDDGEKERVAAEKQAREPKPTLDQVNELRNILKECPQSFVANIMIALSSRKWKGIEEMDLISFNNLLANAIKKRNECKSALHESVDEVDTK